MILIDFLVLSTSNLFLVTILLNTIYLNDRILYFILIIDIIINKMPMITIIIILLYRFKIFIFKYIKENTINLLVLLSIYYFVFGFLIYGIYNQLDLFIIKYLINNFAINFIVYIISIKYLFSKYTLIGDSYGT